MDPTTQPVAAQVNVVLDKLNEIGHSIADGAKPLAERVVSEYATSHWIMAGAELACVLVAVIFVLLFVRKTCYFARLVDESTGDAADLAEGCTIFSGLVTLAFIAVGVVSMCRFVLDVGKAAAPTYHVLKSLF